MKSLNARGMERECLPTFSIKFRCFATSLIKIGRLEFQLTKHSIRRTSSAGGQSQCRERGNGLNDSNKDFQFHEALGVNQCSPEEEPTPGRAAEPLPDTFTRPWLSDLPGVQAHLSEPLHPVPPLRP